MDDDRKKRLLDLGAETLAEALLELASQDDAVSEVVERMTKERFLARTTLKND